MLLNSGSPGEDAAITRIALPRAHIALKASDSGGVYLKRKDRVQNYRFSHVKLSWGLLLHSVDQDSKDDYGANTGNDPDVRNVIHEHHRKVVHDSTPCYLSENRNKGPTPQCFCI
jgi:hypothetical protein